jgi:hypothetical protein
MEKDEPIPLSVDPIGDFLEARVAIGDASATFQQNRARLEAFRRAFPVLPLPDLGGAQLLEHLEKLKAKGVPDPEIEEIREISQAFLDYKNKHGLGAPKERPITSDVPLVESARIDPAAVEWAARAAATPSPTEYTPARQRSAGWILWLLLAVGVGAAYFAWKDYSSTTKGDAGDTPPPGDVKK